MGVKILYLISLVVLGGCISRQEQAEAIPKDDAYCQSIGARPGTDAYTQCRLQLRNELLARQAERRARIDAIGDGLVAAGAQMEANQAAARDRQFNCTSTRIGDTTRTSCN